MILSGTTVRTDQVLVLAGLLKGDELAAKLERGVTNNNPIVALSVAERQQIVDTLSDAPWGLVELRTVLTQQLKRLRDREAQEQRMREGSRRHTDHWR